MTRNINKINGILLLDKPSGITSNKALQITKSIFKAEKAGHTGSLDPIATGLLPICFGQATKVSKYLIESSVARFNVVKLEEGFEIYDLMIELKKEDDNMEKLISEIAKYLKIINK